MTKPARIAYIVLMTIGTIAAVALLLPDPKTASAAAWVRVPLPLVLAAGMGRHAYRAHRTGQHAAADALLEWGALAVWFMSIVAGLGG